jgi:hypothetical protein
LQIAFRVDTNEDGEEYITNLVYEGKDEDDVNWSSDFVKMPASKRNLYPELGVRKIDMIL